MELDPDIMGIDRQSESQQQFAIANEAGAFLVDAILISLLAFIIAAVVDLPYQMSTGAYIIVVADNLFAVTYYPVAAALGLPKVSSLALVQGFFFALSLVPIFAIVRWYFSGIRASNTGTVGEHVFSISRPSCDSWDLAARARTVGVRFNWRTLAALAMAILLCYLLVFSSTSINVYSALGL